ncbi:leukotriene B4 receptor 1-like [Neoarius graeffei]|uniref:leukotriene B4 receptor 1-like n=1 Tax=Neoarius graeffei TaxID=443677 RepID=UPI00298BF07F|nr:leukotriene B4 receptor 1-like [Neoarius graeffei]
MQQLNSSNNSLTTSIPTGNLVASIVMAICFMLGVPGNIAVVVRLAGWLKGGSFTPRLMLSLAISDLLTLLPLPVWIWTLLHGWVFGVVLCKLLSYLLYFCMHCSILCVVLMSIQRYMQVLHPQKWNKLGRKGKKILLSGIWILSGVISSYAPPKEEEAALVQRTPSTNEERKLQCKQCYQNNVQTVATLILEIIILMVSFLTLAYFYFRCHRGVNNSTFFSTNLITKLVIRIMACFFIFWIPFHIINIVLIIAVLLENASLLRSIEAADNITTALVFINGCVDP